MFELFEKRNKDFYTMLHNLDIYSHEERNLLLPVLDIITQDEFEDSIDYILTHCINVNRIFSNAVKFLSIWLDKLPDTLLKKLKGKELKEFFNRTEYDKDGDLWCFPDLLKIFLPVVERERVTATEIMDYLFENFDFLNSPNTFIREVIGYGKLPQCIAQIPEIFKIPLLEKLADLDKKVDIGRLSRDYLAEQGYLEVKGKQKQTPSLLYLQHAVIFVPPSLTEEKRYNCHDCNPGFQCIS